MLPVYYNEWNSYAADWLRNLIAHGLIPPGDIDERDIREVQADDVRGYRQAHFFAGQAGWPEALRLAGWGDRPVWTGSCPCQPFSAAGRGKAGADARHLWPAWLRLIRECRPHTVLGEQVEAAIGHGWLDRVFANLEAEDYACGAAVLGAHSVGAPHIRQRLFWGAGRLADYDGDGWHEGAETIRGRQPIPAGRGEARGLADSDGRKPGDGELQRSREHGQQSENSSARGLADSVSSRLEGRAERALGQQHEAAERGCEARGLGNPSSAGSGRDSRAVLGAEAEGEGGRIEPGCLPHEPVAASFWGDGVAIPCSDGTFRRVEPGLQPLAHGVPFMLADGRTVETASRPELLRCIGNAIVPQAAAEFVRAWMAVRP